MKSELITTVLGAAIAFLGVVAPVRAADRKPNIVHIVADDLGWKDVGFNGCADIKTPNLDALASGGAKFTQFYVQPMCTPTRAALMTGRYPFRYGLQSLVIPGPAGYGLDTNEWLLPQCLKEAGYTTAIIGKWHLGHADTKYWPKQRGFDYQYGAMIGELDYYTHSDAGVLDWFRNNKPVREKGYTTQLLGHDAVKYINGQDPNKPFYLYLTFIWRTLLPTSVDLFNLADDPYEKNNLATAYPDKVAVMQERLNALGKESAKPLALIFVGSVGLKHGKPLMGSEGGKGPALVEGDGRSLTDEGFGDNDDHP